MTRTQRLSPGETLGSGDTLQTATGTFVLIMQADGNLVLYRNDSAAVRTPLWASNTTGHPGASATLQDDGNFVVYAADGTTALWASNTAGNAGAYAFLDEDGSLTLRDAHDANRPIWKAKALVKAVGEEIHAGVETVSASVRDAFSKITGKKT